MVIDPKYDSRAKRAVFDPLKKICHRHSPMIATQCVAESTPDELIDRPTMPTIISVMIRR
jgi:hypothetical protein